MSDPLPASKSRRRLKLGCQSFGLASILLVMNYGALLGGGGEVRMHVPFALAGICMAQLADIFVLAALLFAVLAPLAFTRLRPVLLLVLAVLVPPLILFRLRDLLPAVTKLFGVSVFFLLWGSLVVLLRWRSPRWYQRLIRFGDAAGVFLFLFALCSLAQLLAVAFWAPGPYRHDAAWAKETTPRQHPRVVWIVFDELSYNQTFGNRAVGLPLPNFDALRGQSTLFTAVEPTGEHTAKVIPSLLTGHRVDDYRFSFNNQLKVHFAEAKGWHRLDGSDTVFGDAQRLGWRTAAVGWYNPYCTVFGDAIEQCYAMNLDALDGSMAQRDGVWRNAFSVPLDERARCTYEVRQRVDTFRDLQAHTQQLLRADQADLIFVHLPAPHSPGIWNRWANAYATGCGGSYLDGLALADRTLGQIMAELQASPRWKDTTVIVQGDHSWRTYLWQHQMAWTAEDEQAARGGFDPRPAMLIHRAGQTTAATDDTAWPLLNVHDVVGQVLHQPVR